MQPPPPRWPRAASSLFYDDAPAAIDWLCAAFGFTLRVRVDGAEGWVEHSELEFGEAVVMVCSPRLPELRSPRAAGGCTQALFLYVDDVDAHHARALARGARVLHPLKTTDHGEGHWVDRSYGVLDPEGHVWWFAQRLATHA